MRRDAFRRSTDLPTRSPELRLALKPLERPSWTSFSLCEADYHRAGDYDPFPGVPILVKAAWMIDENLIDTHPDIPGSGPEVRYDADYYRTGCGSIPYARTDVWLRAFGEVAGEIVRTLHPSRVFDAGCAMGMLVESLRDRGVDAWGADISAYAIANIRPDLRPYCQVRSITEPFGGRFDLVTCIEVLEHMPEQEARAAVEQMATATDVVLFSSTPDDLTEPTHINVHPILYWLKLFGEYGFQPDLIHDAVFAPPHAILFRRTEQPLREDVLISFSEKLRLKIALSRREHEESLRKPSLEAIDRIAALEAENAAARRRAAQLVSSASDVRNRLQAIAESPGWRLIVRYREWLRVTRLRHRKVSRLLEPLAARLLETIAKKRVPKGARQERLPKAPAEFADVQPAVKPETESWARYEDWILFHEPSSEELNLQRRLGAALAWRPKFSVIVPVYRVSQRVLVATVESVLAQTYDNWELCIVHADPDGTANRVYLSAMARSEPRIKVEFLESNLGIAGNSNRALPLSEGDFIALLDHDDTLAPFALFEVAKRLNDDPSLDFIYSDADQLTDPGGQRLDPLFKPDWSPDIPLCANYLTHLTVLRTAIVREIGGWRTETDGAQDWDLFLRAIARSGRIAHIPKVLYHWRRVATSVSAGGIQAKPYAAQAQLKVVRQLVEERGWDAHPFFEATGHMRLEWNSKQLPATTVIILSTEETEGAVKYAAALFPSARYPALEIIVVPCAAGSGPTEIRDARLSVVPFDVKVSLASRLNNAVTKSSREVLVFLDQAVTPSVETWLDELIGPLAQPGVGVTGSMLFDKETHLILHAGICFNADGEMAYPFASEADYAFNMFGGANWYRNWLAVSGACFGVRREVFEKVGGFSAKPAFQRLDVDLCLKVVLDAGQRVLYNPFARMWKNGSAVLESWVREDGASMSARHIRSLYPQGDPFFNPNLVCRSGSIGLNYRDGELRLAPSDHNFAAEARELAITYDCAPHEITESKASRSLHNRAPTNRFTWFLPEFQHAQYGGLRTIFRFADYFRRAHGIRSTFVIIGHARPAHIASRIALASSELASSSTIEVLSNYGGLSRLAPSDAAIATLWTTAYYALRYNNVREKFYFLQDDESLFYPAGSTSTLAGATWGFGFKGLCNTITMRDLYAGHGGEAEFFNPCVDGDVFYSRGERESDAGRPHTLFCYARPKHSRNCFETIIEVIRILKRRFGDKLTIITAGEEWAPGAFGVDGMVQNLGLLSYHATGELYRSCDAGLILMGTAHPSYLPLELMACGSLVVTNENPRTAWLLRNGENCLLSVATPSALAGAVEEGLGNAALRRRITGNASRMVRERYRNWDGEAEKIYRYIAANAVTASTSPASPR
jgi:cellulose synthase/poly-beta-1,6-N-acetylglucosamine synthase-like glycosyltransferase/glycosyltransferase involved in cell wall biosynthesis